MSIRRSHEVVNLYIQDIDINENRNQNESNKVSVLRYFKNNNSESSEELRNVLTPFVLVTLTILEIFAASFLVALQTYFNYSSMKPPEHEAELSDILLGFTLFGSLLFFYGSGVLTWITLKHPSDCSLGIAMGMQFTSVIFALIFLSPSVNFLQQEDLTETVNSDIIASTKVIHSSIILAATLVAAIAILIVALLSRATTCCYRFQTTNKPVAFILESESRPSYIDG